MGLVGAGRVGGIRNFVLRVEVLAETALADSGGAADPGTYSRKTKAGRGARNDRTTQAVRFYLEEQFDFHAPERTTEEFLRELSATDLLSPEQKESLGKFLESCDLVKFAKYEPGESELRELHTSAVQLVEETEPRPGPPPLDSRPATLDPAPA